MKYSVFDQSIFMQINSDTTASCLFSSSSSSSIGTQWNGDPIDDSSSLIRLRRQSQPVFFRGECRGLEGTGRLVSLTYDTCQTQLLYKHRPHHRSGIKNKNAASSPRSGALIDGQSNKTTSTQSDHLPRILPANSIVCDRERGREKKTHGAAVAFT